MQVGKFISRTSKATVIIRKRSRNSCRKVRVQSSPIDCRCSPRDVDFWLQSSFRRGSDIGSKLMTYSGGGPPGAVRTRRSGFHPGPAAGHWRRADTRDWKGTRIQCRTQLRAGLPVMALSRLRHRQHQCPLTGAQRIWGRNGHSAVRPQGPLMTQSGHGEMRAAIPATGFWPLDLFR